MKFKASWTVGPKIEGRVKRMAVTESVGTVVFTVAAEDVDTGIGLRNKYMRGYLESDKFPQVTLDGTTSPPTLRGEITREVGPDPRPRRFAPRPGTDDVNS